MGYAVPPAPVLRFTSFLRGTALADHLAARGAQFRAGGRRVDVARVPQLPHGIDQRRAAAIQGLGDIE